MTEQAGKPRVHLVVVFELRIVRRRWPNCMSELSSITRNRPRNRIHVTRRRRSVAESEVTFRADKRRALILLIDLVIQDSTVIELRRNVTTFRATTRFHRDSLTRHRVTLRALYIRVSFMSKSSG